MKHYVGLDWAKDAHAVCVIDPAGQVVDRLEPTHDRNGLADLVRWLRRFGDPSEVAIAIERPSGLLVDTLVEAGFVVVPIHPNVVKASRSRYSAAHAKSDPGDAYLLADLLRTDGHRFEPLRPLSDEYRALRALVRGRDDLVAEKVALGNRLRAVLETYWPGPAKLFSCVHNKAALAFIEKYPTPESARRLGPKRMASFLRSQGYSGRRTAEELLERLRSAPQGLADEHEGEARKAVALALVSTLRAVKRSIAQLTKRIERAVEELPNGNVFMSFPRAGKVNAAQIAAELGDDPARFGSEKALAAHAGVAPVTYASGKKHGVGFRWAANRRLRLAITTLANNSRQSNSWAKHVYDSARSRGKDHVLALRILARAWIRVLWRCWVDGVEYDPDKHASARPHAA